MERVAKKGRLLAMGAAALILFSQTLFVQSASAAISDPGWQKGASFVASSPSDFSSSGFKQSLANFKAAGGNYANFIVQYYQSNTGSTDIGAGYNTPTDASLVAGIQYAHSLGLHVMLTIHLDAYSGQWRANINPNDRDTWFAHYQSLLVHYAQLAQGQGVEAYCLGAELIDVTSPLANGDNTERWDGMIAAVRSAYSGALTYSANRDQQDPLMSEAAHIGFWDKLTFIGLSAYYELPGDGSASSLESDWQGINDYDVSKLANTWHKPIVFTEVGYRSVTNAHSSPWNSGMSGAYDAQEQANDYSALFSYWNNYSYVEGVDLWWWSPDPNYGGSGNTDYTPQNKPAQSVLAQWWLNTPPAPPSNPGFSAQASLPSGAAPGQSVSYQAVVAEASGSTSADIIDVEIYNGATRVYQRAFAGQNFSPGQSQTYSDSWTPNTPGTYTIKIGVFNSDWSKLYLWNDNVASVVVAAGSQPPPGQSGVGVVDMWWPGNGSAVSGVQPFKGLLENTPLSQYQMYWQVDGGQLNLMQDNQQGYAHKEADVDLSGWRWSANGTYTITFVAKNAQGGVVAQKSALIHAQ